MPESIQSRGPSTGACMLDPELDKLIAEEVQVAMKLARQAGIKAE